MDRQPAASAEKPILRLDYDDVNDKPEFEKLRTILDSSNLRDTYEKLTHDSASWRERLITSPDDSRPTMWILHDRLKERASGGKIDLDGDTLGISGSVWGEIVWNKSTGRPQGEMSDAFTFKHQVLVENFVVGGEGDHVIIQDVVFNAPEPKHWTGQETEDEYRVGFMLYGMLGHINYIGIELKAGIPWEPPVPAWMRMRRYVQYPQSLFDGTFLMEGQVAKVFDKFRIALMPG